MMPARHAPAAKERGFTLVELLIAMTIGLLLTLVVAQLFIGSRRAYTTTDALSRMQENMRFAQEVLSRTIHTAGYKSSPNELSTGPYGVFEVNLALDGTEGAAAPPGGQPASDTITVRFQGANNAAGAPEGSIVDCIGNVIGANQMATNIFSIGNDAVTNTSALQCTDGVARPVTIVPNVENMQIIYAQDMAPAPGDATADRWAPISDIAAANRNQIVAVRIALLFVTPAIGAQNAPDTAPYDLVGTSVDPLKDTAIRRVQTMTIAIRNRTP